MYERIVLTVFVSKAAIQHIVETQLKQEIERNTDGNSGKSKSIQTIPNQLQLIKKTHIHSSRPEIRRIIS